MKNIKSFLTLYTKDYIIKIRWLVMDLIFNIGFSDSNYIFIQFIVFRNILIL